MISTKWLGLCAALALVFLTGLAPSQARPAKVDFQADVFPLLRAHCLPCHKEGAVKGKLRFDSPVEMQKGGRSGPLLISGNPAKSLLIARLKGHGGEDQMPLGFAPLSAEKINVFERWIKEGASYKGPGRKHWAYSAPVKPVIPAGKGSSIDRFIEAKLKEQKLSFSPPAARRTLIRRLYLDLIGLPPTLEELAQAESMTHEALVEKLLASPHFGESMALPWLDMARYADSNGYEKDSNRTIWPYRDYVIKSFNEDKPFSVFTEEQLAGDLLSEPTKDSLIATGFHRNTMKNEEGGVDQGEQRWLTLVDRVATTGTAWMAMSIGCAQCHDHKYDPVSQQDFFAMMAYYEPVDEVAMPLDGAALEKLEQEKAKFQAQLAASKGKPEEKEIQKQLDQANGAIQRYWQTQSTLIMKPKAGAKAETLFRNRGTYLAPGAKVGAATPKFLPAPKTAAKSRLDLARWLVDRQNPLTARVQVNRLWEKFFGVGLVKTSEDFGLQGEVPIHRELLDYLAIEFMDQGWRFKPMVRMIVNSQAYRQTSRITPQGLAKDPENRFISRATRFRLPAELIRDSALRSSGLLSAKIGGPSVMPDQPDGIWKTPYSGESWQRSSGEDRWRRGLYTHVKRSSPYPAFMSFDASSRESCTTRRTRTNTPLQALNLLNDIVYLEAARQLADDFLAQRKDRFETLFRRVLSRDPQPLELSQLTSLHRKLVAQYQNQPDRAKSLTGKDPDPERAAAILLAQTLLNLDEAITRE